MDTPSPQKRYSTREFTTPRASRLLHDASKLSDVPKTRLIERAVEEYCRSRPQLAGLLLDEKNRRINESAARRRHP